MLYFLYYLLLQLGFILDLQKELKKRMKIKHYHILNEEGLGMIIGGDDCFFLDVGCITWGSIKRISGMIKPGPYVSPTCIPKSSWNPASPVPCP